MRLFLTVLLAIGSGTFASSAVFAQQAPHLFRLNLSHPTISAQARPVQPNRAGLVAPGDRAIQRDSSSLVAATTVRPCPVDICREVRPGPSYNFYPDSTLRSPLFFRTDTTEGGIFGRSDPFIYRNNILRSLFPLDEADASTELGVYVQANF